MRTHDGTTPGGQLESSARDEYLQLALQLGQEAKEVAAAVSHSRHEYNDMACRCLLNMGNPCYQLERTDEAIRYFKEVVSYQS
jgi:hypothetical protein